MENKVFAFQFCDCIYESAYATISLHRTRKGAEDAERKYRDEFLKGYYKYRKFDLEDDPFWDKGFAIEELKILD